MPKRKRTKRTGPTRARGGWRETIKRHDALERLEKFLGLLKLHGILNMAIRQACGNGKVLSKDTIYKLRERRPDFKEEMDDSGRQATEELEATGMSCAQMAKKDPRYQSSLLAALRAKCGWGQKKEDGSSNTVGALSAEEIAAELRRDLQRMDESMNANRAVVSTKKA